MDSLLKTISHVKGAVPTPDKEFKIHAHLRKDSPFAIIH